VPCVALWALQRKARNSRDRGQVGQRGQPDRPEHAIRSRKRSVRNHVNHLPRFKLQVLGVRLVKVPAGSTALDDLGVDHHHRRFRHRVVLASAWAAQHIHRLLPQPTIPPPAESSPDGVPRPELARQIPPLEPVRAWYKMALTIRRRSTVGFGAGEPPTPSTGSSSRHCLSVTSVGYGTPKASATAGLHLSENCPRALTVF